jgi:CheY-like chemotaxis protein
MSEGENEIGGRALSGTMDRGMDRTTGSADRVGGAELSSGGPERSASRAGERAVADDAHVLADGVLDVESSPAAAPSVVIVDADAGVRATLREHLEPACAAHEAEPAGAVALLQGLSCVDIALVDCDPPPSQQAPIFRALARWPGAVCVLMSQNHQKVEQLRALGMFAPLVLDKPLQPEALDAIRAAVLEISDTGL